MGGGERGGGESGLLILPAIVRGRVARHAVEQVRGALLAANFTCCQLTSHVEMRLRRCE